MVESNIQVDRVLDVLSEGFFRPIMSCDLSQIPDTLLHGQFRFKDDHILRPTDLYRQIKHIGVLIVGAPELPHPAKVSRRKAGDIGVALLQVFCRGNSGTFFFSGIDGFPDLGVHLHLLTPAGDSLVQCIIHFAVVYDFTDIHAFLLSDVLAS